MHVPTLSIFTIDEKEMEKINEWLKNHVKNCPHFAPHLAGAFGSPIHYIFTPHGIGTNVEVQCNCGERVDVTNSDNW
ncbi:MAG: hypothetical protein HYT65_03015 [Candidatus Yanofskybacteria bacterium]|nr:hypothetical protein [Candidatus Yanofskybacteria bacterium]